MASLDSKVNGLLGKMHESRKDVKQKGTKGEDAVFSICEHFYQTQGGILIHSYEYAVDRDLAGNIKKSDSGNLVNHLFIRMGCIADISILISIEH